GPPRNALAPRVPRHSARQSRPPEGGRPRRGNDRSSDAGLAAPARSRARGPARSAARGGPSVPQRRIHRRTARPLRHAAASGARGAPAPLAGGSGLPGSARPRSRQDQEKDRARSIADEARSRRISAGVLRRAAPEARREAPLRHAPGREEALRIKLIEN